MIRTVVSLGYAAVALAMADIGGASAPATDPNPDSGDMGKIESETGFLSLAQLAGADTSDITALTSRVPPAGVWRVRGESVKLAEGEGRDGKANPFRIGYIYLVMHGQATDPDYDNEKMVDRKVRESVTLWPEDVEEGIGLTKGRFQKAGINCVEPKHMGGIESMAPGWLDNFVASEFNLRIRHGSRNGETVAYYDWLPLEQEEAGDE